MNKCLSKGACIYNDNGLCMVPGNNPCGLSSEAQKAGAIIGLGDIKVSVLAPPPSDLSHIAGALERIAKELEKQNKLKAATLRATIENDYLDEIMED